MSEWFWIRDTLVVPGHETVAKATEVCPLLALNGSLSLCLSFGGRSARRAATPVVSAHDGGGWSGSGTSPHQHNHEWHLQPRRDQWPVHLNGPVHPSLPHIDHRYVFRMSLAPLHTFTGFRFRVKGNAADNSANTHCGPSVKTCQTHLKVKQA